MTLGGKGHFTGLFPLLFLSLALTSPARGIDLQKINNRILTLTPLMTNPLNLPHAMDRSVLMIFLSVETLPPLQPRYFQDGTQVPLNFYQEIQRKMALEEIPPRVPITFALVTHPTLLRGLPTDKPLFKSTEEAQKGDLDRNLYSLLPPGTPVAMAHTTTDGKWAFVLSTHNPGWVTIKDLMPLSLQGLQNYVNHHPFVVITAPHAPIFSSPLEGSLPLFTLPMGTRLPLVGSQRRFYRVLLPSPSPPWRAFYIPRRLATRGYLPFQKETLLHQAINLLGEPYSWGGKEGVDCSLLVREVFATTGVLLPRNSSQQAGVGTTLWTPSHQQSLEEVLEKAPPGRTLLFLPGHVMIYAGREGENFKVIHSLYSWQGKEVKRVVITPLKPFKTTVIKAITIP